MGDTLCDNSITIEFDCQFRVDISDSSLATILIAFSKLLPQMLMDFIQKVLLGFGEKAMGQTWKPFSCDKCGNNKEFIWKTRHGKETKILTIFQWVKLEQLQVQCKGKYSANTYRVKQAKMKNLKIFWTSGEIVATLLQCLQQNTHKQKKRGWN